MFDVKALADVTREVWTVDLLSEGMLWPGPVTLYSDWMVTEDAYLVCLANEGRLYSYIKMFPPHWMMSDARSLASHIDSQMLALRQAHFMRQAASRGGYY